MRRFLAAAFAVILAGTTAFANPQIPPMFQEEVDTYLSTDHCEKVETVTLKGWDMLLGDVPAYAAVALGYASQACVEFKEVAKRGMGSDAKALLSMSLGQPDAVDGLLYSGAIPLVMDREGADGETVFHFVVAMNKGPYHILVSSLPGGKVADVTTLRVGVNQCNCPGVAFTVPQGAQDSNLSYPSCYVFEYFARTYPDVPMVCGYSEPVLGAINFMPYGSSRKVWEALVSDEINVGGFNELLRYPLNETGFTVLSNTYDLMPLPLSAIVTAGEPSEKLLTFAKAVAKAGKWMSDHPLETARWLKRVIELDPDKRRFKELNTDERMRTAVEYAAKYIWSTDGCVSDEMLNNFRNMAGYAGDPRITRTGPASCK